MSQSDVHERIYAEDFSKLQTISFAGLKQFYVDLVRNEDEDEMR